MLLPLSLSRIPDSAEALRPAVRAFLDGARFERPIVVGPDRHRRLLALCEDSLPSTRCVCRCFEVAGTGPPDWRSTSSAAPSIVHQ